MAPAAPEVNEAAPSRIVWRKRPPHDQTRSWAGLVATRQLGRQRQELVIHHAFPEEGTE